MHTDFKDFHLNHNQSDFLAKWKKNRGFFSNPQPLKDLISSFKKIEKYLPKNKLIIVNELSKFKPIYISPSVESILGYTPEEYLSFGHQVYLPPEGQYEFNYLQELLKCGKQARKNASQKIEKPIWGQIFFFGRQHYAKDGIIKKFLVFHRFQYGKNQELPNYDVIHFYEIDHFVNSRSTFWFSFNLYDEHNSYHKLFKYDSSKHEYNYLLSNREKEILIHIASGKSSKETAAVLNISSATVDKHRKNAIHRLGVRDITSLIQVCKICGEL